MTKMTSALAVTSLTCALLAGGGSMAAATEPTDPPVVYEVGLYVYEKLDPTKPAAWANSGTQTFIAAAPGFDWFTTFPGGLPDFVCGPGWAVQQDLVKHEGFFTWPVTITYPNNVLSQAQVLVDAEHADLETLVTVPDCAIEPTPTPTPDRTVEPTPLPPLEPPVVTLPETGAPSWLPSVTILGFGLLVVGMVTLLRKPRLRLRHG